MKRRYDTLCDVCRNSVIAMRMEYIKFLAAVRTQDMTCIIEAGRRMEKQIERIENALKVDKGEVS